MYLIREARAKRRLVRMLYVATACYVQPWINLVQHFSCTRSLRYSANPIFFYDAKGCQTIRAEVALKFFFS